MSKDHLAFAVTVFAAGWLALAPGVSHAGAAPEQQGQSQGGVQVRPDGIPARPAAATPRMNNRCNTTAANCILSEPQPAGSSCWCVTPFGPSYGRVP